MKLNLTRLIMFLAAVMAWVWFKEAENLLLQGANIVFFFFMVGRLIETFINKEVVVNIRAVSTQRTGHEDKPGEVK